MPGVASGAVVGKLGLPTDADAPVEPVVGDPEEFARLDAALVRVGPAGDSESGSDAPEVT